MMRKAIFGVSTIVAVVSLTAMIPARVQAQTEVRFTQYQAEPQVLDSWMQPKITRTREITNAAGEIERVEEPLVLERHERVLVPTTETTSNETISRQPQVTSTSQYVSLKKRAIATAPHRACRHVVAHRAHSRSVVAMRSAVIRRETKVEQPVVIEDNQRTVERPVIIERRDPALDLY